MKFKKINCGITGHTGVLGSELIKENLNFIRFKGDITKKKDLKNWLKNKNIDIIFHLAAVVPTNIVKKRFQYANKVNYLGTKFLVDEIIKSKIKIKWFFFSSTSHVYAFSKKKINEKFKTYPTSKYGLTKLRAELYLKKKLKKNKIPFCIGRIFSFTHKNQSKEFVIPNLISKALSKKKILFNNTNHYRDFLSVRDICRAIKILFKNRATGIYNIGSGKKTSISHLINIIFSKYKKKYSIKNNSLTSCLISDNKKIKKFNWRPKDNIHSIIKELF
tara:strand:- start:2813 stop:3637 length:825 start_codon:yes stop_codon:yes gene_type:complete